MGGGSVMSGGGYSNKPSNVFSNAPSTMGLDHQMGRIYNDDYLDLPPPTFTPAKQANTTLAHFYDEILTIDELLDLKTFVIPSYPASVIGGARPASGFTSVNVTPSKTLYTKG